MNILIIGATRREVGYHYSDMKTINLAKAFVSLGYDVYMPKECDTYKTPEIKLDSMKTFEKTMFQMIIFTRENYIKKFSDQYPKVKEIINKISDGSPPYTVYRFGKPGWYKEVFKDVNDFYRKADLILPQTWGICKKFIATVDDLEGKIWASPMGVPEEIQIGENPYQNNKINLVYMGRLRHTPSRFGFFNQVMHKLGQEYVLHIFPGSFSVNLIEPKRNPIEKEQLDYLKTLFTEKNIVVHAPAPWGKHWNFLHHANIGVDVTPSLHRKGVGGGNAKLLEYMAAGLPSISEIGVTNLDVMTKVNGGIVVQANNVNSYIRGVQKMNGMQFNRAKISELTRSMNSFKTRALEIIEYLGMSKEVNLFLS